LGFIPAAIVCNKKTHEYEKIANHFGNIFQMLDDINEVHQDKGRYCTYFSCNIDKFGVKKTKAIAKRMIMKEIKMLEKYLADKPSLQAFKERLLKIVEKI